MSGMKIYILTDNETCSPGILTEHGLSLMIELGDRRILFDMGMTDVYRRNADTMGLNLHKIDYAVISHGHYDHGGGLSDFLEKTPGAPVYVRKNAFSSHESDRGDDGIFDIGIEMPSDEKDKKRIVLTGQEHEIEPGITLFAVPKLYTSMPLGNRKLFAKDQDGRRVPDDFMHEQNLLIQQDGISLLVAGCAHRGIPNILAWVNERFGVRPDCVIGGFHLSHSADFGEEGKSQLREYGEALKNSGAICYTDHCTGMKSFRKLRKIVGNTLEYAYAGNAINIRNKEKENE